MGKVECDAGCYGVCSRSDLARLTLIPEYSWGGGGRQNSVELTHQQALVYLQKLVRKYGGHKPVEHLE